MALLSSLLGRPYYLLIQHKYSMVFLMSANLEHTAHTNHSVSIFDQRRDIIYGYLDGLDTTELQTASEMADVMVGSGNMPLAQTVVVIPVAATQEAHNIVPAMSQYDQLADSEPFSIVLGLNEPIRDSDSKEVAATTAAVNYAIEKFPDLDIRTVHQAYDTPVIGRIRRDLWNAVALASERTGGLETGAEVVVINHDIDVEGIAPGYVQRVQDEYDALDHRAAALPVSPVRGTYTSHAASPKHPRISQTIQWEDYTVQQAGIIYEAGTVIPLSYYAEHGGFDPEAEVYEVSSMSTLDQAPPFIPGTAYLTSPRRYLDRMNRYGMNVWAGLPFTAHDRCREPKRFRDISRSRQLSLIEHELPLQLQMIVKAVAEQGADTLDLETVRDETSAVFDRIVGPSYLDDIFDGYFDDAVYNIRHAIFEPRGRSNEAMSGDARMVRSLMDFVIPFAGR